MKRREWLQRSAAVSAWAGFGSVGLPLALVGCGGGGSEDPASGNVYRQTNLAATSASFSPLFLIPDMINAWGVAIRPAGAGGHFWVTATSTSYEFVGDVNGTPLEIDPLLVQVTLPFSGGNPGAANGIVFNSTGTGFRITQSLPNGEVFTAPAKFIFVSDNGVLSAWAQRANADGSLSYPDHSNVILDEGAQNTAFFGLAISPTFDKLYAADFGNNPSPRIRVFNDSFVEEPLAGRFANPFVSGTFTFGDYAPWAIHTITIKGTASVFVAYVKTLEDPDNPGQVLLATESTGRGTSRLVEYTPDGQLVAIWNDRGTLNGPWGVALAPANFGPFSDHLIVANFTDGTLVAFDTTTKSAVEFLRDETGAFKVISGIWGILFGNGVKLGDTNALYFAAGPADETEGLFGSLRVA